ncbi:histidine phosphatase family protein [Roseivivax sp. THAF30]|uniref:histidine phosphatase family protein n=1 Tax=Roseivivax sp. THAF30 TaxID=2587852 RepID=UPI0012687D14|nr:histidine phosphatase family protein [Roseivivax sp. THAF30]QFT62691.1 hypothetical protein FIU91_07105 [Roseivivax sp. THAF30]
MRLFFILLFVTLPSLALSNDWDALNEPGSFTIMRHALAPGTGDPPEFELEDCSTQRNLDERGRDQARRLGDAIREQGIAFDIVLTSQWCRSRETAEILDVAPVSEAPALNSFFGDFERRDDQTNAARNLVTNTEGKLLLVSHQVNISALTGQGTRSGEMLIVRLTDEGAEVLGSVLIEP